MTSRLVLGAAVWVASATAVAAEPHRIVVLDFDGPRNVAVAGRDSLLGLIGERYEVVSTQHWQLTRENAPGHGPEQWQHAAERIQLDAVIDGWVTVNGDEQTMTITVREAATGIELGIYSATLEDNQLSSSDGRKVTRWIQRTLAQFDQTTATPVPEAKQIESRPAGVVDAAIAAAPARLDPKRFEISTGVFLAARGMQFRGSPSAGLSYPASALHGVALAAAAYPFATGTRPSGIGASIAIEKSAGGYLVTPATSDTPSMRYALDHLGYEAGVHVRYPFADVAVDAAVNYGKTGYATTLPMTAEIPDVDYRYLGARARVDTTFGSRARVGLGVGYQLVLGAGDIVDDAWYGAATASAYTLDASVHVPLGDSLFVTSTIDYRHFTLELDQSGDLARENAISAIADSTVSGTLQLGVVF